MKEVIKFAGNKEDLVWIYPKNTISQDANVIVEMGYLAVMIKNGEMDIPYFPGTNDAFNEKQAKFSLFNNKRVSDCSIYYFNTSIDVSSKEWGTRYPIKYFDKRYKMELTMRGHGTYKIHLENPRLLLKSFKIDSNSIAKLESSIKDIIISKLTASIAQVLTKEDYDLLSIHGSYDEITKKAQSTLNVEFEAYGFSIFDLSITYLEPVEEDKIKVLRDLQFKSAVFDTEFEMANKVRIANNEDILVQNQVKSQHNDLFCPTCHSIINSQMRFCASCGEKLKEVENGEQYGK